MNRLLVSHLAGRWFLAGLPAANFDFALFLVRASLDLSSFVLDRLLFFRGMDGPLQRHHSILHDDLDIVRISRKRFVLDQRPPDVPRQFAIGLVVLLLVSRRFRFVPVALVVLGVVRKRCFVGTAGRATVFRLRAAIRVLLYY